MAKNRSQSTSDKKQNDLRRRELAAIHIGKKKLGMDDVTYREMLFEVARVESAADLDQQGRRKILDHLRECGFNPAKKSARASGMHYRPSVERAPFLNKIGRLLEALDLPWAYADGMAKRMFGINFVRWLNPDQLRKVLIALIYHQKRKNHHAYSQDNAF